ncbi:hypothetical protein MHK_002229 [Candidatus Magnetomorum sp. HK-1]|nr:hypothetical protein MHK_002229 [Candidatus Magnetomorum sp. HK-1]
MEMQVRINSPDAFIYEMILKKIGEIKETFSSKDVLFDIIQNSSSDPWDNLNIDEIAVDSGIEDFAEHHAHYIYGVPKRS